MLRKMKISLMANFLLWIQIKRSIIVWIKIHI